MRLINPHQMDQYTDQFELDLDTMHFRTIIDHLSPDLADLINHFLSQNPIDDFFWTGLVEEIKRQGLKIATSDYQMLTECSQFKLAWENFITISNNTLQINGEEITAITPLPASVKPSATRNIQNTARQAIAQLSAHLTALSA